MAGPGLPTNVDATHADTGSAYVKQHQQHHDAIHGYINAYGGGVIGESLNMLDPRVGAVGDGVTDNAAAFGRAQTLLDANGGRLFFPPGNYLTSAGIQLVGQSTVAGAGERTTTLTAKAGPSFSMFYTPNDNISRYSVTIESMLIDGNAPNMTGSAHLIEMVGASGLSLSKLALNNPRGYAIHWWNGSGAVADAVGGWFHQIRVFGHPTSQNHGIVLDSGSSDASMVQVDVGAMPGTGIILSGHSGAILVDVSCWLCKENGFYFYGANRVNLTGCLADWPGEAGYKVWASPNAMFTSCKVNEPSQAGPGHSGFFLCGDMGTNRITNVSLVNCYSYGTTATDTGTKAWIPPYGIALDAAANADGMTVVGGVYAPIGVAAFNPAFLAATNVKVRGVLGASDSG
jgi:hypothetical protein